MGFSVILARLVRREWRWSVLTRLAGEYETVVAILGGGVAGGGFEGCAGAEGLGLGAKKREITCCFCFPIAAAADCGGGSVIFDG